MQKGEHETEPVHERVVYEGEFGGGEDDLEMLRDDHVSPMKSEHFDPREDLPEWALENILEEQYEEEEFAHEAIRKSEHHLGPIPVADRWRSEFHSHEDPDFEHKYRERAPEEEEDSII